MEIETRTGAGLLAPPPPPVLICAVPVPGREGAQVSYFYCKEEACKNLGWSGLKIRVCGIYFVRSFVVDLHLEDFCNDFFGVLMRDWNGLFWDTFCVVGLL